MVVGDHLQDIFDSVCNTSVVTLPKCKPSGLKIEFQNSDIFETVYRDKVPPLPFVKSEVFYAHIDSWRRLTAENDGCKSVYEVSFDITGQSYDFSPGDTIGIIPHNTDSEVDVIIKQLGIQKQADLAYNLSVDSNEKSTKIPVHIPVTSTLRHVLKYCVDIRCIVKKLFLLALSKYTTSENEKKILEFLCSKEGSTMYNTHILDKSVCILDIFVKFKSCKPPVEVVLANLPRLLPRPYSIINSSKRHPSVIKICFSVMDIGNHRRGLTTDWLEGIIRKLDIVDEIKKLNINDDNINSTANYKIPLYLRKNTTGFNISQYWASNLILVGPGTGVSQFIGLLEGRQAFMKQNPDKGRTEAWLFFGCRDPKLDFIYDKELKEFVCNNILCKLCTAFSRVDNYGIKYVQDAILAHGSDIARLIEQDAVIIVCGDVRRMATQVRAAFVQCLTNGNRTRKDAEELVSHLERAKRYYVDVWN